MSRENLNTNISRKIQTYYEKYKHIQEKHNHKYEYVWDKNIDMKNLN